ncbi:MAG: hypothetical protein H7X71_03575 [Chitinophagales bacterium]|nr:hypothetical protein [Chitinophagales bacterium]
MDDINLFEGLPAGTKQAWLEQVKKDLKGADFEEKLVSEVDGIRIEPIYSKEDLPAFEKDADESPEDEDGEDFSYTPEEEGASVLSWDICEEIHVDENNSLQDIISAAFKRGVNYFRVSGNTDLFFDDIRRLQYGGSFQVYIESDLTEEEIVKKWREVIGFIGHHQRLLMALEFDPITRFAKTGNILHEEKTFNNLSEIFIRLLPHLHDCRLFSVDTTLYANAGATATQQLAYALAITTEYFDRLSKRKIVVDEMQHLLNFRFSVGSDYFLEIAKLRAFKILWHNLMRSFAADIDMIPEPHIHAVTTNTYYPGAEKYDTLVHATTQAMSAVLGGCSVLSVTPYEKSEDARRYTTNIQNILRFESYFDRYRAAANGSFYIETLTTSLAEKAWKLFQEIESNGGFINCLKQNIIQGQIKGAAVINSDRPVNNQRSDSDGNKISSHDFEPIKNDIAGQD